jgi:DNA-binding response OmpR family regulator
MGLRVLDDVATCIDRRQGGVDLHATRSSQSQATAARIVLVEDEQTSREMMSTVLLHAGHAVQIYCNGESALTAASAWNPTAAIIDIGLPGISGYAVAQHMRKQFGPGVLLIALTSHDTPEEIAMARYAGFNWHFSKPALPSRILEVLQNPRRTPNPRRDGIHLSI